MISIRVGSRVLRRPQGKIRGKSGRLADGCPIARVAFSGNSPFLGPGPNDNQVSIVDF